MTRPRRLVLIAVAALVPVLAGCEAGNNAPTLQFHYPTASAGRVVGQISIRNVFVLGAPLGKSLHRGQSASLFLSLINDGATDKLVKISAPGTATSVAIPAGGIPVVLDHPVNLSGPRPQLILVNLTRTVTSGSTIRLVLTFQNAGAIPLIVPVFPRASHFKTYAPPTAAPSATSSTSATKSKSHSSKATRGASPTPTPSSTP